MQLSRLELEDVIRQEINENPVLEETDSEENADEKNTEDSSDTEEAKTEDKKDEFDWKDYIESTINPSRGSLSYDPDREEIEPIITKSESITDHLLWQLYLHDLTGKEQQIGEYIIGNLDKDGYLKLSDEDIALNTSSELEQVQRALSKVQKFDPVGIASRNLQECLLTQAELLPGETGLLKKILSSHMRDLERRKYQVIARSLKVSLRDVVETCEIIADMEPRPGRAYSDRDPQYITPDIYVFKVDGEYIVVLNEDGQPKLRVSYFYKNLLSDNSIKSDKAREYIQEKLRSAVWLIKSVYHRQSTIVNVMKSIIKFQRDFFDYGTAHLKPLVLRDVADDIEMHESNISRVTTNKFVHTPHGIYELKYFFNSGLSSDEGGAIASESVKNKIMDIIQSEDSLKPHSDLEIANILKKQGVNIARRTVTKYREMKGILSSSKRKKHY